MYKLLIALFVLQLSGIAQGQVYRCDVKGAVLYQQLPCPTGSKSMKLPSAGSGSEIAGCYTGVAISTSIKITEEGTKYSLNSVQPGGKIVLQMQRNTGVHNMNTPHLPELVWRITQSSDVGLAPYDFIKYKVPSSGQSKYALVRMGGVNEYRKTKCK